MPSDEEDHALRDMLWQLFAKFLDEGVWPISGIVDARCPVKPT
jgi:hypothetical protein